jgi:hypothetical protein
MPSTLDVAPNILMHAGLYACTGRLTLQGRLQCKWCRCVPYAMTHVWSVFPPVWLLNDMLGLTAGRCSLEPGAGCQAWCGRVHQDSCP